MAVRDEYNDSFLLPSMGDYYFDALDHVYYKVMEDAIHEMVSTGNRKDKLKKAGLKTAFKYYQENPPDIGYDERYESYTFGVNIQDKTIQDDYIGDARVVDGDTIVFPTSSIAFPSNDEKLKKFVEVATNYSKQKLAGLVAQHGAKDTQCTGGILGLRFACIDTMEIPHFENIGSAKLFTQGCAQNGWDLTQKTFSEAWNNRPLYNVSKFWDYRMTSTAPGAFSTGRPMVGQYNIPTSKNVDGSKPEKEPMLNFVKIDNRYHQYYVMNDEVYILGVDDSSSASTNNTGVMVQDNTAYDVVADAGLAHKIAFECVLRGSEMRIVVDGSSINQVGSESGYTGYLRQDQNTSNENITKFIKYIYQQTLHPVSLINTGYSWAGLDVYNRALAVIYVKMKLKNEKGEEEEVWINLNKYLVANTDYTNIDSTMHSGPSQARNNFYSDLIKAGNYDLNKILYVDGEYAESKKFDDRGIIQERIWKNGGDYTLSARAAETAKFNETDAKENTDNQLDFMQRLNHWTMTIGDCTFFIPPECIRLETISQNKKLPVIRAKGSMQKNSTKVQEIILIDLYFNGEKGINGFEFKTKVPKGDEITYHMNGLRALIAQFRLAPFLPIDNYYVNRVLGIDAVALKAMSTQTVPGFPQLLKVSLQLQNFDYRIYMPEIPIEDDDVFLMRNYFSKQINYQIFRWYYQRLLINGDKLKDVSFFDDMYMRETFGNKTCLVPMKFESSAVRFYIPNREHLNMMKQVKLSRLSRKAVPTNLNDGQKTVLKDFDKLFNAINNIVGGKDGNYKKLNDVLSKQTSEPIYIQNNGFDYNVNCVKIADNGDNTFSFKTDNETEECKKNVLAAMKAAGEELKTKLTDLKNTEGNSLCTNICVRDIQVQEGESQTLSFEKEMTSRTNEIVDSFPTVRVITFVSFEVHPSNISKDDMKTLLTYATQQQGDENLKQYSVYSADEILSDDGSTMNIPITVTLKNVNAMDFGGKTFARDASGHKVAFLAKFGNDEEAEKMNNSLDSKSPRIARAVSNLGVDVSFLATMEEFAYANSVGGNELANKLKQSADYEDYNTIKWDYFDMGDEELIVENMSFTEMNTFAEISLSSHNGYAPQFMGGTDIGITFSLKTKSQFVAGALKSLPGIAAEYAREFRLVLSCWPVKMESELTKLMGITDVMIETVDVNTIPGYPGVYEINVTASSVDRTLRNREAMTRKQLSNFTQLDVDSKKVTRERTRMEIEDYLSERELYPDLQLPTIKEFNEAGFLFVRYSNAKRVYPDPDFYFTYSYMLYNQLIRESVLRGINENLDQLQCIDTDGNLINGSLYTDKWDSTVISKEKLKKLQELNLVDKNGKLKPVRDVNSTKSNDEKNNANHKVKDYGYDRVDGTFGKVWNIANNIKICPMEKNFVSDIVAYKRLKEKIDASLKNGNPTDESAENKYDNITKADIIKERHKILTEQNKKNNEASDAAPIEESSSLSVLGTAGQPLAKTLKANGMDVEKTKAEGKNKENKEKEDKKDEENKDDNKSKEAKEDSKYKETKENKEGKDKENSKDNEKTKSEVDTPSQSNNNNPSVKVDEKDNEAEPYNIKKWEETAEKTIKAIDEYLSKPIEAKEYNASESEHMNCKLDYITGTLFRTEDNAHGIPYMMSMATLKNASYENNLRLKTDFISMLSNNVVAPKETTGNNNEPVVDLRASTIVRVNDFITAAGAAMSASEEYSNNTKEKNWKLRPRVAKGTVLMFGTKMDISVEDRYEEATRDLSIPNPESKTEVLETAKKSAKIFGKQLWSTTADLANYGIKFGIFQQVMHSANDINKIFDSPDEITEESVKQENTGLYLIDPYYRNGIAKLSLEELDAQFPRDSDKQTTYGDDYTDEDDDATKLKKAQQRAIRLYKAKCVLDERFCRIAFWRVCLVWLRKLIKNYILPSFCYDVFRGSAKIEDIVNNITKKVIDKRVKSMTKDYTKDLKDRSANIEKLQQDLEKAKADGKSTDAQIKAMEDDINNKIKARDELRQKYDNETQKIKAKEFADMVTTKNESSSIQKMFEENAKFVDDGKIFLTVLFATLDTMNGASTVLKMLVDRDIDQLNTKTRTFLLGSGMKQNLSPEDEVIRKYVKALVGYNVIGEDQLCKGDTTSIGEKILRRVSYNNYVAAANDPMKWLTHSFHDMVVHDARGRMARAFPTFFMCFIDEGRTTRRYKLHDNFYNTSSIADITITKSRKIPADTAEITMSNFYQTFTTDDEDLNYNYTVNIDDVISSIFGINDFEFASKLENRRQNSAQPERFHIRPGARIHIRMGYGGDASSLPILFNGIVTEVSAEDVVNVVAQGDGQELAKPILMDKKASEIPQSDNFLNNHTTNGVTPKVMLDSIFTTYGTFTNKIVHENISKGGTIETIWDGIGTSINPFNLFHFGDRDYQYIDGEKEPTQNIFEIYCPNDKASANAMARKKGVSPRAWDCLWNPDDDLFANYGTVPDFPLIEFEMFNKSIWEIAHILNGIQPNYITSIAPFDFRSTFFFGCPHDYYAYSYQYVEDGSTVEDNRGGYWQEKRKPFQQYHIVSSVTDIISNQVTASAENISTCMVGLFKREGSFNGVYTKQTDPIWVDKSIYPEFQKTSYFDTNLFGAPSRKLWIISDIMNWLFGGVNNTDLIDKASDTSGEIRSHTKTAEILTKNALKENIWDMYQGPLVIIGDPTIKPYDRMRIVDFFQEIHGDVQVRDVVYNMSPATGFTTVVYPDVIATVSDYAKDEIKIQTVMGAVAGLFSGAALTTLGMLTTALFKFVFTRALGLKNILTTDSMLKDLSDFIKRSDNVGVKWLNKKCGRTLKTVLNQGGATKNLVRTIAEHTLDASYKVSQGSVEVASKAKNLIKVGKEAGTVLRAASWIGRAGISVAGAGIATGASAVGVTAGLVAMAPGIAIAVAGIVALEVAGSFVANTIDSAMRNRRAITIFPLKHYNRIMVAGINGHTGLCYGSPSWSAGDMLENTLAKLGEEHPNICAALSFGLLGGTDPFEMAANNKRFRLEGMMTQQRIPLAVMDEVTDGFGELSLKTKVNPTVKRMKINSSNMRYILKNMGVFNQNSKDTQISPSDLHNIAAWKDMILVSQAASLKKYIDDRYFRIANEQPGFNNEAGDRIEAIKVPMPTNPNSEIEVNAMKVFPSGDNNSVFYYDVPFLRPDAIAVLASIVDNAYMLQYGTEQERDEYKKKQNTGTSAIVLKSALRIGESSNMAGTGLRFEIEATDKNSSTALTKAVETTANEFVEEHNHNPRVQKEVFKYQTKSSDGNGNARVIIVVMPPDGGMDVKTSAEAKKEDKEE